MVFAVSLFALILIFLWGTAAFAVGYVIGQGFRPKE